MKTSLFNYGFRPFFLAVGVAAMVLIPLWASSVVYGTPLGNPWPPTLWHAHEMLFGVIAAAIAGFLLTAVPSWTGTSGFAGGPLKMLLLLWILGRASSLSAGALPLWLIAVIDLSFLPAVGLLVAPRLLVKGNRNAPLLGVLAALTVCNGVFHWAVGHSDVPLAGHALIIGIDIVLVLATVIGGRIVPSFSSSTLKQQGRTLVANHPLIERSTIALMIAIVLCDAFRPESVLAGVLALGASFAHVLRMSRWQSFRTWREPIVWSLHLGYAWIPLGLALKGIALLSGAAIAAFWLHALTVGALSTLILAVMTRAALGHTGRALVVAPTITAAYLLLLGAGLMRVFGLRLFGGGYPAVILGAAALWTAAFGFFVWVYAPILMAPRADGKPG
jgi:uncharacterized protein involved in response to NO